MEFETKEVLRLIAELIECEADVLMTAQDAMHYGPNDARTYERALWPVELKLRALAKRLKETTDHSTQCGDK